MSRDPRHLPRPELEIHARYVMLSKLATEKRVLDIGGDTRSALLLAEAEVGELTVAGADPRQLAADLAEAGVEGVDVIGLPTLPLSFADSAFDLIICHELGQWVREDPAWVSELRRALAPEGYLAFALANPGGHTLSELAGLHFEAGLTYQEAFNELNQVFGKLTLFGQWPVVAHLFCDFEDEPEEPSEEYDRSLLPDESDEPGWYLLIFGPDTLPHSDRTIIQIPFQSLAAALDEHRDTPAAAPAPVPEKEAAPPEGGQALDSQLQAATAELDETRGRVQVTEEKLATAELKASDVAMQLDRARQDLEAATTRLAEAEGHVTAAEERVKQVETDHAQVLTAQEDALASLKQQAGILSSELETAKNGLTVAGRERDNLQVALDAKKAELEEVRARTLKTADEARVALETDLATRTAELEAAQVGLRAAEQSKSDIEAAIADITRARDVALENLGQAERNLEQAQTGADDVRAALETELATLREAHAKLEAETTDLRAERSRLTEALTAAEAQRDELTTKDGADHQRAADLEVELQQTREVVEQTKARFETQVTELEGQVTAARAQAEANAGRIQELAEEQNRQAKDRTSFEEQIKDLLEEAAGLRDSEADLRKQLDAAHAQPPAQDPAVVEERDRLAKELVQLADERDALAAGAKESESLTARLKEAEAQQAEAVHQEKVKNEQLREELARVKMKHSSLEAEHEGLAAEVQRLTDLLHDQGAEAPAAETPATEAPVIDTPPTPSLSPPKDSVGRPIEKSLADIEDLIANSVPPPQNRR